MKHLLVCIFCIGAISLSALHYGPIIGAGCTWLEGEELHGEHPYYGLTFGITTRLDIGGRYHLRPEINFIQKGAYSNVKWYYVEYVGDDGSSTWSNHRVYKRGFRQNYLSIPVIFEADFLSRWTVGAGPFLDVNISPGWMNDYRITTHYGVDYDYILYEQDWAHYEWGALFELSYKLPQWRWGRDFELGLRYHHNFSRNDIWEEYATYVVESSGEAARDTMYMYTATSHVRSVNHGNIYLMLRCWM